MAVHRGIFVRATGTAPNKVGTTPLEARLALSGLLAYENPGLPRPGIIAPWTIDQVSADSAGWGYYLQPMQIVTRAAADEGAYIMTTTGVTRIPTDPAPATGSRWDIIYAKQNDVDKGDPDNLAIIDVAKGTAATSPTKPTIPAGALALAEARIYSGTQAVGGVGSNTLTMVYPYTSTRGSIIPVRDLADRNNLKDPPLGQQVIRLDRDNQIQTYTGLNTVSGWEWLGVPRRYYADTMNFSGTVSNASKAIYTMTEQPLFPYATRFRVNGRLHVSVSAISSGVLQISMAVSAVTGQVTTAQAKSRMSFVPPGGYWQTSAAETNWIDVGAGAQSVPRIWIEYISGTINTSSGATAVYAHLWVEVLPAND